MRRIGVFLVWVLFAACCAADEVDDLLRDLSDPSPEVRQQAESELLQRGEAVRAALEAKFEELEPEARFRVEILLEKLDARAAGLSHDELQALRKQIDELQSEDQRARAVAQKNLLTSLRQMPMTGVSHRGAVVLLRILLPALEGNNAQILAIIPQIAYSLESIDPELEPLLAAVDEKTRWGVLLPMALGTGVYSALRLPLAEAVASDMLSAVELEAAMAACLTEDAELGTRLLDRALTPPYLYGALTVLSFGGAVPESRAAEVGELLVALSRGSGKTARRANAVRGDLLGLGAAGEGARERMLLDGELPGYDWSDTPLYSRRVEAVWGSDGFTGQLQHAAGEGLMWNAFPQGSAIGVMLARGLDGGGVVVMQITLSNRTYCNVFSHEESYQLAVPRYTKTGFSWWMLELSQQPFDSVDDEANCEARVLELLLASKRRDLTGMLKTQQISIERLEAFLPVLPAQAALELAVQIATGSEAAVQHLIGCCADSDALVRLRAAETLAPLGAAAAVEVASRFLAEGRRAAALAIIDALQPKGSRGALDPKLLLPFLQSESKALAGRAVIHLEDLNGRVPGEHDLDPEAVQALIAPWIEKLSNDSGEQP